MKISKFILPVAMATFFLVLPGCGQDKQEQQSAEVEPIKPPAEVITIKGTVLEVIDNGKFIYLLLDRGEKQTWATMPAVDVEVGEDVTLLFANIFQNFYSKSMERSFDELIFSAGIEGKQPRRKSRLAKQPPPENPR
jgi:hypothetical protein